MTAVGTGRSTGVRSEAIVSYECNILEKKFQLVRESMRESSVLKKKNHCIICKRRERECVSREGLGSVRGIGSRGDS